MQIQISWLLQKPIDLDLHCLQRQCISGFSKTRVNYTIKALIALDGRLSLSVGWENGPERGHKTISFNPVCKGGAYPGSEGPGLNKVLPLF